MIREAGVAALAAGSLLLAGAAAGERVRARLLARLGIAGPGPATQPRVRLGASVSRAVRLPASRLGRRRRQEIADMQLADAVGSIAAGLRAGLSLSRAIRYAAEEGEPPLAERLREVTDREAVGVALGTSLEQWARSNDSPDVRLAVGVLLLQQRTGGDLPAVLDQLASTLAERRAATREMRSLTAQARLSGAILGLLPLGFFLFLSVISREDMLAALGSPAGVTAISTGLALQAIAFLWIRRLLRVEV